MKNIVTFILIVFVMFFTFAWLGNSNKKYRESLTQKDTVIQIDTFRTISHDSILKLANEAMEALELKRDLRKNMMNQIQQKLEDEELTKKQIQVLKQQSLQYEQQLEEHLKSEIVKKDSVVYNIQYRDTMICKPVFIPDTIIIEVLDTVKVKKLKKRRRND
tara:strand:+ start:293 stop:775 length:483 start_codon:yes stop_codon:yes gene_type:complete